MDVDQANVGAGVAGVGKRNLLESWEVATSCILRYGQWRALGFMDSVARGSVVGVSSMRRHRALNRLYGERKPSRFKMAATFVKASQVGAAMCVETL